MSYGAAKSLTEVSPRASCARMPRRVASERAPKVASSVELKCLTIWFTIDRSKKNVKRELGGFERERFAGNRYMQKAKS